MPELGAHAFLWADRWDPGTAAHVLRAAADHGLGLVEVPLLRPEDVDAAADRREARALGLELTCSLGLPRRAALPDHPEAAEAHLGRALEVAAELGSACLTGVVYGSIGGLSGSPPTERELDVLADSLRRVARRAAALGLALGLEPVNRYETHLLNTAEQTVALISRIGERNLFLHLDTYHMNIEEKGFGPPLRRHASELGYLHLSESDRGVPGTGNVRWEEVFDALAAIGYDGPLVYETFPNLHPDLARGLCIWRPVAPDPATLAREGLAFLRQQARRAGLVLGRD